MCVTVCGSGAVFVLFWFFLEKETGGREAEGERERAADLLIVCLSGNVCVCVCGSDRIKRIFYRHRPSLRFIYITRNVVFVYLFVLLLSLLLFFLLFLKTWFVNTLRHKKA